MERRDNFPDNELILVRQINQLDDEELEEEEVDSEINSASSDDEPRYRGHADRGTGLDGYVTFDTSLASSHSYLGEVDDVRNLQSIPDGGTVLTLPIFYLEGVVLFPEATLPLRVVQQRFRAAVHRAMRQEEAPHTIGVVHVNAHAEDGIHCSLIGTTAEIRQFRELDDGTMNVVTCGQQRFHLLQCWIEADGAPCAKVQIITEEQPLHVPKGAFGSLAAVVNYESGKVQRSKPSKNMNQCGMETDNDKNEMDDVLSYMNVGEERQSRSRIIMHDDSSFVTIDEESSSSDDDIVTSQTMSRFSSTIRDIPRQSERPQSPRMSVTNQPGSAEVGKSLAKAQKKSLNDGQWGYASKAWGCDYLKWNCRAQFSAWPYWVYQMYDAYGLARRVADMWRQMFEKPSMDDLLNRPDLLSFHIASKIPANDSTKQELLEISNVSYRLRREIQLLESIDHIRCKGCMSTIARRRDILVMSSDGPVGAYANPHGFVFETLTLYKTKGLVLKGHPETRHSWFPGYAWTIVDCMACDSHMGWFFSAVRDGLHPKSFWGVRRSQLADPSQ